MSDAEGTETPADEPVESVESEVEAHMSVLDKQGLGVETPGLAGSSCVSLVSVVEK